MARATFTADDDPIDVGQIKIGEWSDQRLTRQEANRPGHAPQLVDAPRHSIVLDTRAKPNVVRHVPSAVARDFNESATREALTGDVRRHSSWSLGEYLKLVPRGPLHYVKDAVNERRWDLLVKEIAH
jgi:hypothetical protein